MKKTAILLMLALAGSAWAQTTTRYFRQMAFNHNSPLEDYAPTHEISAQQARDVEHYEAIYDAQGRLTELRNYCSETWRRHPMTHLGAFRMTASRDGGVETRLFYDQKGARTRNLREVYKEVYRYDARGERVALEFYDLSDKPMNSNWGVARYAWERRGEMVIERRYNVQGELVPLAESFPFHISGMKLNGDGRIVEHCNLNDALQVVDNRDGIACYKDIVSVGGDLIGVSYYNTKGELVSSPWRFAVVRNTYDDKGEVTVEEMLDKDGRQLSRTEFHYDARGKLLAEH